MDLNKHLTKNPTGELIVTGKDHVIVYINRSLESTHTLSITDVVRTMALFDIMIDGETRGFFLPAIVTMKPSNTSFQSFNSMDYVRLEFAPGDVFLESSSVVQNGNIAFVIFSEFIRKGHIPDRLAYDDLAFVFDLVKKVTGCSLPAEHAVFEMIFAHLARDPKNYRTAWRHSAMAGSPKYLKLSDIPHAAGAVTNKLSSAYLNDSLASSMVNAAENPSDLEELLRH